MKLRSLTATVVVACLLTACGNGGDGGTAGDADSAPQATPTRATEADPAPATTTQATQGSSATESEGEVEEELSPLQGIDASHHQGPIDWARVAEHGVSFAYLKASEGTGFVDPRFADHRTAAGRQGVAVAGYHYFQLCSDGAAQAAHFIEVLGEQGSDALAPALDLELAGSCTEPPARGVLLREVREFLSAVDEEYATKTVVYLYPDFEDRFAFAPDLADHPQWVRRLGDRAPRRPWLLWQYDDQGSVPGIAGPVDLNLMQPVP